MIQALLMILAGCYFFDINTRKEQVLLATILQSFAIRIVRGIYVLYQIPYGSHTLILALIFCLVIHFVMRVNMLYSLAIAGFSFSLIMLGGGLVGISITWLGQSIEYVLNNALPYIIFGQLENIFLIIYLILYKTTNFSLKKLVKERNE
jgi:hypothetical protein